MRIDDGAIPAGAVVSLERRRDGGTVGKPTGAAAGGVVRLMKRPLASRGCVIAINPSAGRER